MEEFGPDPSRQQDDILTKLKRNFTKISKTDIENSKTTYLDAYGIKYMECT